jgi:phage terminase large subunit
MTLAKSALSKLEQIRLLKLLRQQELEKVPDKLRPLYIQGKYDTKVAYGGRGAAKSWTMAIYIIKRASKEKKLRILCTREIQESIKLSVYSLLVDTIHRLGYPHWKITETYLYNKKTKSKIVFRGLRDIKAAKQIKSYESFDIVWCEEAETILQESWDLLRPTVRKKNSELLITFNRYEEFDPVYNEFCLIPDAYTLVIPINWRDNPYFTERNRRDMEKMKKLDYDKYMNIWEGHPIAQIENAVIPQKLVSEAVQRNIKPEGGLSVGVDMAAFGSDSIAFYMRKGLKIIARKKYKHQDVLKTADDLENFIIGSGGSIYTELKIDKGGMDGGGLIPIMRKKGFENVIGIDFGGVPKDKDNYANVATEMFFELLAILPGIDMPDYKLLRQDLTCRKYGYNEKRQKKIEKKKDFKDKYKHSPDDGDAFLLCFYNPGNVLKVSSESKRKLRERVKKTRRKNRSKFMT